jgi:hypothetical protein
MLYARTAGDALEDCRKRMKQPWQERRAAAVHENSESAHLVREAVSGV